MSVVPQLVLRFDDVSSLRREVEANLSKGRAFVPCTADLEALSDCVLVIVHPDDERTLELPATVVMISSDGERSGAGLQLAAADGSNAARLLSFVGPDVSTNPTSASPRAPVSSLPPHRPIPPRRSSMPPGTSSTVPPDVQQSPPLHVRLRSLSLAKQVALARRGELAERVALERLLGKYVWEALLHNPRVTVPEVARIARKGTVPRPLLDVILANAGWLRAPPVRRALLSNPRLSNDGILAVLRKTPRPELKLLQKSLSYPSLVRTAASKLLKGSGG